MSQVKTFKTKIFFDGADLEKMKSSLKNPLVKGVTTNPTLMKKAGVKNYKEFAQMMLNAVGDLPVSFEVFSDELVDMQKQAETIASWGKNIYVKIPVTNTKGQSTAPIIKALTQQNIKLNVTAILTLQQVKEVCEALKGGAPSIVSVFAGRIADTGLNPTPIMKESLAICRATGPQVELLWASPRQILNLVDADQVGCDIITMTPDLINKISVLGKDLQELSLDTVKMFYNDAKLAELSL
ncbi:MAG: transaldolase [Pseudobdellovibrio sp.]